MKPTIKPDGGAFELVINATAQPYGTTKNPADDGANADTLPKINVDDLETPLWENDPLGFFANYDADPGEIDAWGLLGGRPALPRKGITLIHGGKCQGKSLSVFALAVALLGNAEQFGNFTPIEPRPNGIIIADTVMTGRELLYRHRGVMNTIGQFAGRRLITLRLTKCNLTERWDVLQKYVAIYNPQILVIDDVSTFIVDSYDFQLASRFCRALAKLAENRTVIAVVNNYSAGGWETGKCDPHEYETALVAELAHFCEEEYCCERRGNGNFELMAMAARATNTDGCANFKFAIDAVPYNIKSFKGIKG